MDFENPVGDTYFETEGKPKENRSAEGNQSGADVPVITNGYTNGYPEKHIKKDKSESKEKHKDRDKDRDKHKEHRDKDRHKDKDRHSSSGKDKDRHHSSSGGGSSSKDKDRDRDKDKDRKHRDDKGKDRDDKKNRDEKRDKDSKEERKDKDEKKDKDREHKSSSSSKDKEHKSSSSSSKDKEKHSSSSSSNRDKDKHHSSSSSSKDKDKHSSSSSSKDKHSSSSSKDKHNSSSSDKDKHRDRDKHRDKTRDKEKSKSKESDSSREKKVEAPAVGLVSQETTQREPPNVSVKMEMYEEDSQKLVIKEEPMETEDPSFYNLSAFSRPSTDGVHIKSEDDSRLKIEDESRIKSEEDTEDDTPLAERLAKAEETDEDDVPIMQRQKMKKAAKKRKAEFDDDEDDEDFMETKKKKKKVKIKAEKEVKVKTEKGVKVKVENDTQSSPKKRKKGEEEAQEVWKWWEEEKKDDGNKWHFLEHKGPVFAPPYEKLPSDVKFFYDGKELRLSEGAEEVATFYARMLDHDYVTKEAFNKNFFKDWRKMMTEKERELIKDLSKCNFKHMHAYFVQKSEERKAMSKEEKKKIKEQNEEMIKEYGFCKIDGHKEKIGNFKIEPPGLFRGRGEHPKMGMLKRRVMPEDIIINCSKDSEIPKAPPGHRWKEVRYDKSVTWLASWTENVQGQVKYIMLNPSSKLKGEKDMQKYETARKLAKCIDKIRHEYREDWKSKEMRIRQRAVALYFIDKLALRAGNEKDEDQADTVGCCSLRVEHISLHEQREGKENVVVFDFLGKDSIRYYNEVSVEKRVFKNLQLFMENKSTGDDLFDRLNTTVLNKHLNELMEGLTAKVFRTYNASITLQDQLSKLTDPEYTVAEKILAYNRANRAVAILCNHQRAVPKTHAKSMENLKAKIEAKRDQLDEAEKQYKQAKRENKSYSSAKNKIDMDKRKKQLDRIREQLAKLELQATDKEENKEIALGTSKLNYLDPRISVAWCKKHEVPIEKIYNKTQRDKFRWAIDMAGPDYVF